MPVAGQSEFCHNFPKHRVLALRETTKMNKKTTKCKAQKKNKKSFTKRHSTSETERAKHFGLFSEHKMDPIIPGLCTSLLSQIAHSQNSKKTRHRNG